MTQKEEFPAITVFSTSNLQDLAEPRSFQTRRVVQIYVDGDPYLYGNGGSHAETLEDFLQEFKDKTGRDISEPGSIEEFWNSCKEKLLPPKAKNYQVAGMGHVELNPRKKRTLTFRGSSATYDIGIDQGHLDALREQYPEFTFYEAGFFDP